MTYLSLIVADRLQCARRSVIVCGSAMDLALIYFVIVFEMPA